VLCVCDWLSVQCVCCVCVCMCVCVWCVCVWLVCVCVCGVCVWCVCVCDWFIVHTDHMLTAGRSHLNVTAALFTLK